jgi:hypothetical protein
MDMQVTVLLALSAVVGVVVLETRQMKSFPFVAGLALGLFAVAMLVVGATEVGVGGLLAGAVLVLVLRWGVSRTSARDEVPAFSGGAAALCAVVTLVAFIAVALLAASNAAGPASVESAEHLSGGAVSLVREALVVGAAAAAVWAMLRKTGRRDE